MASCVKTWCSLERRGMVLRFVRRSGGRTERTASVGTFIALPRPVLSARPTAGGKPLSRATTRSHRGRIGPQTLLRQLPA
jgi:hypothetical protein